MYTLIRNKLILGNLSLAIYAGLWIVLALLLPSNVSIAENQPASSVAPVSATEFWYTINYKGEKIGYMHIVCENVPYQQANAWKITTETIQYTKILRRTTYLSLENFSFLAGLSQQLGTDIPIQVQMRLENDKIIFTYPPPNNQIDMPLPEEKIYCEDSIGKWLIQQSPTVNSSYSIAIIYEERVFNISDPIIDLNLKILEKVKERVMDKEIEGYRVECQYTDNTIIPNDFEMLIDLEGNLLKLTKGEMIIIKTSREDARAKRRDKFIRNNRPDPFVPKYTPKKGNKPISIGPTSDNTKPKTTLSRLEAVAMVKNAHNILDKMIRIKDDENYQDDKKEKTLSELYLEILAIREKIGKTEFIDLQGQMEQILKDAETVFPVKQQIYTRAQLLRNQSAGFFAQIKSNGQDALKKDYFGAILKKVQEINTLASREEIRNTDYEGKVTALANEVKNFNRRAEIIREFYTSRNIKIGGVVRYATPEDISLPSLQLKFFGCPLNETSGIRRYHTSSAVLINGQFYSENTRIDENLFLKNITEDKRVVFIYKEEEIILRSNGN